MARLVFMAAYVLLWFVGGIPIFTIFALAGVIAYVIVRPKGLL